MRKVVIKYEFFNRKERIVRFFREVIEVEN